ncbi:hypothetical protein GALMADRAFT_131200 [Galerina marginata CBS 339.88]|uniref:Uncharacterized protein n=1 Tax=Galerina marginata (strain CBS 339.88) TaxID=685588 RepID=A0A067S7V0_GALM3|nr:hypothetical protein GALMADRAFT_131200 [Galerina marginata CBS 339.88]
MLNSDENAQFIRSVPQGVLEDFRQGIYTQDHLQENWERFLFSDWVTLENRLDQLKVFLRKTLKDSKHVQHEVSDAIFLRYIPQGTIEDFRQTVYVEDYIKKNWEKFLTSNWIAVESRIRELRKFVSEGYGATNTFTIPATRTEAGPGIPVDKVSKTLSDNEKIAVEVLPPQVFAADAARGDWTNSPSEKGAEKEADVNIYAMADQPSDATVWLDSDVTSTVSFRPRQLNRERSVDEVETVIGLPSYYPVPRTKRAYILDLSDNKYQLNDDSNDHKLIPLDALVKDKDQDSWRGGTGKGDSTVAVDIFGNGKLVSCRRSRLKCCGVWACTKVDRKLVDCTRHELDGKSFQQLVNAQIETRLTEADTAEKRAALFFIVCQTRTCPAKDSNERACSGQPVLRTNDGGRRPFIGCSDITKTFPSGHRFEVIPDDVNPEHLATLFAGGTLDGINDELLCSRIVPAHIGGRVKLCKIPHNSDGTLSEVNLRPCPASRTIYIPLDPTIRVLVILYDHLKPHNHPILPATKTSREVRELYSRCIDAVGSAGSTVQKIENAPSTRLILGKTPSLLAPALQDHAVKGRLLTKAKKKAFPFGVNIEGVTHLQGQDIENLPVDKRYIQSVKKNVSGADIIFTANPYLLSRIHKALTIQVDTTFKRVVGALKEWEVAMWDPEVQRALTVARVYTNRADTVTYKMIFDELQGVVLQLTGKPLLLKALSRGGTLLSIGVDLELAQALGAGQSFLSSNEPEYSGIPATASHVEIIPYFVRACLVHIKRGIHSLKEWVTQDEYEKLMGFPCLETQEDLDAFSAWIMKLGNSKVTAWWEHKVNNVWIIPTILKFKSKIKPNDWDRTPPSTNMGESQHHYTNLNTGIGLSLLEAILSARILDDQTALEIQQSITSGVLKNGRNDSYTRTSRSMGRASTASRKLREAHEQVAALDTVVEQIHSLTQAQKENAAKIKELRARKGEIKSAKSIRKGKAASYQAESNSSGKVNKIPKLVARARKAVKVKAKRKSGSAKVDIQPSGVESSAEHQFSVTDVENRDFGSATSACGRPLPLPLFDTTSSNLTYI